jgi:hypothetical protein
MRWRGLIDGAGHILRMRTLDVGVSIMVTAAGTLSMSIFAPEGGVVEKISIVGSVSGASARCCSRKTIAAIQRPLIA